MTWYLKLKPPKLPHILHVSKHIHFHTFWKPLLDYCWIVWSSSMDKRDVGLFRDDWGCTCPSQDRLQTFSGSRYVDGLLHYAAQVSGWCKKKLKNRLRGGKKNKNTNFCVPIKREIKRVLTSNKNISTYRSAVTLILRIWAHLILHCHFFKAFSI